MVKARQMQNPVKREDFDFHRSRMTEPRRILRRDVCGNGDLARNSFRAATASGG